MERKTLRNVVFIEAKPGLFITRYDCDVEGFHWPHLLDDPEMESVCPGSGGEGLTILRRIGGLDRKWMVVDLDRGRRVHETIKAMDEPVKITITPQVEVEREVYAGTRMSCGNKEPHFPHITGAYDTERYGRLFYYCPGCSGGELEVYEDKWTGDAQTPDESLIYIIKGNRA
jgi:hypothetical protein